MDQDHEQFSKSTRTGAAWDGQKQQVLTLLRASLERSVAEWEAKLAPASLEQIIAALSRCLTLTAPSGMTKEDRTEWLTVAAPELLHLPSIIFDDACAHARRIADHPAKILPTIMKYEPSHFLTRGFMEARLREVRAQLANIDAPKLESQGMDESERRTVASSMGELVKEMQRKVAAQGAGV